MRADLEWIAHDYLAILNAAHPEELDLSTNGTAWTNRQLLFHMLLGQRVTRILVVMAVFSHLPSGASRAWAAAMAAVTSLYHRLNRLGGVIGGRLFSVARMGRQMEAVTAKILRFYDHASPSDLHRGMTIPRSWDPYFSTSMDRAQLMTWAPLHYQHHRWQLTLTTLPPLRGPHMPRAWRSPTPTIKVDLHDGCHREPQPRGRLSRPRREVTAHRNQRPSSFVSAPLESVAGQAGW